MEKSNLSISLNKKIQSVGNSELKIYIDKISNKYNISIDDLLDTINDNTSNKCLARKQDGLQCTRNKKPNCDYCGKHIINRKFGNIDKINDNDNHDCIRMSIENIDNVDYLIDDENLVYTNNIENPTLIGSKTNNGIVYLQT